MKVLPDSLLACHQLARPWLQVGLMTLAAALLLGCQLNPTLSRQPDMAAKMGEPKSEPKSKSAIELIAGLEPGADQRLRALGLSLKPLLAQEGIYRLTLPDAGNWIARLRTLPGVRFVEARQGYQLPALQDLQAVKADFAIQDLRPNDPEYRFQWNLRAIGMEKAWDLGARAEQVIVAVIDSGIDPEHPDLAPHLLPGEDIWGELAGPDRLVNRRTGDILDFAGIDGNGHGTHVAGIIGALLDNRQGVAGIAGAGVKLLPIKVTNLLGATDSVLLVAAVKRAIERGAQVINMSIGASSVREPGRSQALREVILLARQRGILVVAASGNESQRSAAAISAVTVPAAYDDVIAVGAFTQAGEIADYSNGGPELDLLAPGGESRDPVFSTWPTYPTLENLQRRVSDQNYAMASGTSMAAPHVSAVAALLLAREPHLNPAQLRARLIATADDMGSPGFDQGSGYGRLNAHRALSASGDDARF
jgi:subtilisin family serine protease